MRTKVIRASPQEVERISLKRGRPRRISVTCLLLATFACWSTNSTTGAFSFPFFDARRLNHDTPNGESGPSLKNMFLALREDPGDADEKNTIGTRDDDEIDVTSLPSTSQPTDTLTEAPTDTQRPSPSPSMIPSAEPSQRPTPQPTFPATPIPTPIPTPLPTPIPTPVPTTTPIPTPLPTPIPTTPIPTPLPTPTPTPIPTLISTEPPTPSPTVQPTLSTPSPSPEPTPLPTFSPTRSPTISGSVAEPSSAPTSSTLGGPTLTPGTTDKPTVTPTISESPQEKPVPLNVPLPDFNMILTTDSEQSDGELDQLAASLDDTLTEYIVLDLTESLGDDADEVAVDLTVTPKRKRRRLNTLRRQTLGRRLQQDGERTATFSVTGSALVVGNEDINQEDFEQTANDAVQDSVNNFDDEQFLAFAQINDPNGFGSVSAASSEVQNNNDNDDKPGIVSIVFGCLIASIGLVMTGLYAFVLWKKCKKRAAKRRQQKLVSASSQRPQSGTESPSKKYIPGFLSRSPAVVPTPRDDEPSPELDQIQEIIESESSGEDDFARELKWAASLDRRVWEEYEKQQSMDKHGKAVGPRAEPYAQQPLLVERTASKDGDVSYYSAQSPGTRSLEVFNPMREESSATVYASPLHRNNAARGVVGGLALRSFPYGDEDTRNVSEEGGVEVTKGGQIMATTTDIVPYKNEEGNESAVTPYDTGWSEASTGSETAGRQLLEIGGLSGEEAPNQGTWSSSFSDPFANVKGAEGAAAIAARKAIEESNNNNSQSSSTKSSGPPMYRASPTPTATSSGAVLMPATNGNDGSMAMVPQTKEEKSLDSESLLTSDIVREVQMLSRFVKRYERRRERQARRQQESEQDKGKTVNSARSAPALAYDNLSDSSSLRRRVQAGATDVPDANWALPSGVPDSIDDDSTVDSSSSSEESSVFSSDSESGTPEASEVSDASRLGISPFKVQDPKDTPTKPVQKAQPAEARAEDAKPPLSAVRAVASSILQSARNIGSSRKSTAKRDEDTGLGMDTEPRSISRVESPNAEMDAKLSDLRHNESILDNTNSDANWPSSPGGGRDAFGATSVSDLRQNEAILDNTNSEANWPSSPRGSSADTATREFQMKTPFSVPSARTNSGFPLESTNDSEQAKSAGPFAVPPARTRSRVLRAAARNDDEENPTIGRAQKPDPVGFKDHPPSKSRRRKNTKAESGPPIAVVENKRVKSPRSSPRHQNKGFSNTVSLFEAKPKNAIFPPNESWQYNY